MLGTARFADWYFHYFDGVVLGVVLVAGALRMAWLIVRRLRRR